MTEKQKAAYVQMQKALEPFAVFMDAFDKNPVRGLDPDEVYGIHGGGGRPNCPDGASIHWDDLRAARKALKKSRAA